MPMPIIPEYQLVFKKDLKLSESNSTFKDRFGLVYYIHAEFDNREQAEKEIRSRIDRVLQGNGPYAGLRAERIFEGLGLQWEFSSAQLRDHIHDLGMNYVGFVSLGTAPIIWGKQGTQGEDIYACSLILHLLISVQKWIDELDVHDKMLDPIMQSHLTERLASEIEHHIYENYPRYNTLCQPFIHVNFETRELVMYAQNVAFKEGPNATDLVEVLSVGTLPKMVCHLTESNLKSLEKLFPEKFQSFAYRLMQTA
jgi:hypothetical protein